MKIDIKVCTSNTCQAIIEDATPAGEYLPESSTDVAEGRFRRSDVVTIDMLVLNKTEGEEIHTPIFIAPQPDPIGNTISIKFDGWFSVCRVVLPTKEWLTRELEKETGSAINLYQVIYYSDGSEIYKYVGGECKPATLKDIVTRNTEGTTLSVVHKNYVSICFLKKCYLSLCQQIFNSRGFSKCWNKSQIDSDLVFRRDLLWMAINVIKYRVEFNQLAEAQRIIEQIGGCNGLCKQEFRQTPTHGCGCSKG